MHILEFIWIKKSWGSYFGNAIGYKCSCLKCRSSVTLSMPFQVYYIWSHFDDLSKWTKVLKYVKHWDVSVLVLTAASTLITIKCLLTPPPPHGMHISQVTPLCGWHVDEVQESGLRLAWMGILFWMGPKITIKWSCCTKKSSDWGHKLGKVCKRS